MNYYKYAVLATLCCVVPVQGDYKNAEEARQALFSAHVTAFAVDNLLTHAVPQTGYNNWYNALNGVQKFIDAELAKQRTIPISQANRDMFAKDMNIYRNASDKLINTIKILRNTNNGFKKEKWADIDLDKVKASIAELASQEKELLDLQSQLEPALLDIQATKDIKKMLKDIAIALEASYKALRTHFEKIRPGIRFAIDQKKQNPAK